MPYLAYLAGFFVVLWLARRAQISRSHRLRAAALGCQPPHIRPLKLPLGLDNIIRLIKADRRGQVPDEIQKIFGEQKKYTFKQSMLGTSGFATADPRNIQALLANQFLDFEIGDNRRLNFAPMLGVGIFTADGQVW